VVLNCQMSTHTCSRIVTSLQINVKQSTEGTLNFQKMANTVTVLNSAIYCES